MGAFADWMTNKLQGRERLKAGAFDIPEDERDPLSLNSYWTPAEEAQAASDGGALDQAMAVAASPVTMAKGLWHGITNFLPSTERMMTRTPQSDAEIKQDALDAFGNVGMAALGAGPAGALTAQARRAALPGAFAHEIPFDLPPGPGRSIDMSTPAIHTGSTDLFDYGAMQGIAPDNPLKIPSHKYYEPPRGLNENAQALLADRKVSRGLSSAFDRGIRQSGEVPLDWYNMEPLRQRFGEMYQGPMSPDDAFLQFNDAIAASSVMNPVDQNMRNASQVYQLLQQGKQIPRSTAEMPTFAGPGGQTRLIVNRKLFGQEPGWDPFQSPKVDNFRRNLSGDQSTVTVDSHASRAPGMFSKDPRFLEGRVRTGDESGTGYTSFSPREMLEGGQVSMKDLMEQPTWWQSRPRKSEYGAFAKLYERLADRKGVSPAQAQAAAWYGNADMTGVVTPPKTALQILEDVIKRNAERNGISDQTMLSDMINGRRALYANQARAGAPAIMANIEKQPLDMSKAARLRRAEEMGFDTSQVWYHGTPNAGFTEFSTAGTGKTKGTGAFFADNIPLAAGYSPHGRRSAFISRPDPDQIIKEAKDGGYYVEHADGTIEIDTPSGYTSTYASRQELVDDINRGEFIDPGPGIYPVYLKKFDPEKMTDYDMGGRNWDGMNMDGSYNHYNINDPDADYFSSMSTDQIARELIQGAGEEGVLFRNVNDTGPYGYAEDGNVRVVTRPEDIRHIDADFDPAKAKSGNIFYANQARAGAPAIMANIMARMREERIPASVSGEGMGASNYPDMAGGWAQPPGSGQVTRQMLDAMDQATPATRGAFDTFEMRQRALAENMHNRAIAERYGLTTRADLMRMREIYGKEGFEGLRAALARGDALPSNADVAGIAAFLTQHEEGAEP